MTALLTAILFVAGTTHNSGVSFARTSSSTESSICIDRTAAPAHIQFRKGRVDYVAVEGSAPRSSDYSIADGDMFYTGIDGFVSIILADGSYRNIHPDSLVTVRTSSLCEDKATPEHVSIDIPYLNAAIRG